MSKLPRKSSSPSAAKAIFSGKVHLVKHVVPIFAAIFRNFRIENPVKSWQFVSKLSKNASKSSFLPQYSAVCLNLCNYYIWNSEIPCVKPFVAHSSSSKSPTLNAHSQFLRFQYGKKKKCEYQAWKASSGWKIFNEEYTNPNTIWVHEKANRPNGKDR